MRSHSAGEPIAYVAESEGELDEAKSKASGGSGGNGASAPPPPPPQPEAVKQDAAAPAAVSAPGEMHPTASL